MGPTIATPIVRVRVASLVQAILIVRDRVASLVLSHMDPVRATHTVLVTPTIATPILHLLVRVILTVLVTPTTILTQVVLRVVDQVGVVRKAAARVEVLRSLGQAAQNLMQRGI